MYNEKTNLRQTTRQKLAAMDPLWRLRASQKLAERIKTLKVWKAAKLIALFAGQAEEVEVSLLFGEEKKRFLYPKMDGDELIFKKVAALTELEEGKLGIWEPTRGKRVTPDLLLVPGLAFDAKGGRLGRGKGFYDRWLAAHPAATAIGICFDFQMVDVTPMEAHDRRMDWVVTEKAIYSTYD